MSDPASRERPGVPSHSVGRPGLSVSRQFRHHEGMRTRTAAAAAAAAIVLVALTGCTPPSPFQGVARAACEKKVGPAVVVWWRDQYAQTPWKVVDTHTTGIEQRSGQPSGTTVFSVSGESAVQREERGSATDRLRWSCSARTTVDDPSTVSASVLEIRFR